MSVTPAFRGPAGPDEREAARRSVDEELAFHLEETEEELVAEGMEREAARREARRRFGDLEAPRRYCVEQQTAHRRTQGTLTSNDDPPP